MRKYTRIPQSQYNGKKCVDCGCRLRGGYMLRCPKHHKRAVRLAGNIAGDHLFCDLTIEEESRGQRC